MLGCVCMCFRVRAQCVIQLGSAGFSVCGSISVHTEKREENHSLNFELVRISYGSILSEYH